MDQYPLPDFRNSQLRRKYDGLKYTLNMETMLYELSLGKQGGPGQDQDWRGPAGGKTCQGGGGLICVGERGGVITHVSNLLWPWVA